MLPSIAEIGKLVRLLWQSLHCTATRRFWKFAARYGLIVIWVSILHEIKRMFGWSVAINWLDTGRILTIKCNETNRLQQTCASNGRHPRSVQGEWGNKLPLEPNSVRRRKVSQKNCPRQEIGRETSRLGFVRGSVVV